MLREPAQPPGVRCAPHVRIPRFSGSSPASARRRAPDRAAVTSPARRARSSLRVPPVPRDRAPGRRRAVEAAPIFALGSGDAGGEPDRDAPRAHEPGRGDERPAQAAARPVPALLFDGRDGDARVGPVDVLQPARGARVPPRVRSDPVGAGARAHPGGHRRAGAPARRALVPLAVPDAEVPAAPRVDLARPRRPARRRAGVSGAVGASLGRARVVWVPAKKVWGAPGGGLRARPVEGSGAGDRRTLRGAARRGEPPHRDEGRAHRRRVEPAPRDAPHVRARPAHGREQRQRG